MSPSRPSQLGAASPTKAMLAGEYAVLSPTGEALTITTPPFCTVLAQPAKGYQIRGLGGRWEPLPPPSVPRVQVPPGLRLPAALLAAAQDLGLPLRPPSEAGRLTIRWVSSLEEDQGRQAEDGNDKSLQAVHGAARLLPPEALPAIAQAPLHRGPLVGSSAALCAALATLLLPEEQEAQALPLALAAHRRFQGGGSGYDVAACFCAGASRFSHGAQAASPASLARGLHLVLLHSGLKASTARLLGGSGGGRPTDHPALLEAHALTSHALIKVLCGQAPREGLGQAVASSNQTLRALDRALGAGRIFTPELEAALATLEGAGYHAKVSGAGGGDFVVGFRFSAT